MRQFKKLLIFIDMISLNFSKKNVLLVLLTFALVLILGKNYIINEARELAKLPSIRIQLINIAKVAIPLKNFILLRSVDDKIALIKSSNSCVFCNLTQANFKGSDLTGVNLSYANLSGANLSNSNLTGANLSNSNLTGVNLTGADFSNTIWTGANLSGANLSGVDFSNKEVIQANLSNSNLTGANLSGLNLIEFNLSGANLTKSILIDTNLSNANLAGAILLESNIQGAALSGANLSYANLSGTNLSNANLVSADLYKANLQDANLQNANLSGANLTYLNLARVDLSYANLSGAILNFVDLSRANLSVANLSNSNLSGADLSNTDLTGTILTFANLSGANLYGVDLSKANLSGANLDGVDLSKANLSGANLDGVDLSKADLTGTIVDGIKGQSEGWTRSFFEDIPRIKMIVKNSNDSIWVKEAKELLSSDNLVINRYDFNGDSEFIALKEGFLYDLKNNESKLVLDLNTKGEFYFPQNPYADGGLLGLASINNLVYIAYSTFSSSKNDYSLVVDEYSLNFNKTRNIIKIDGFPNASHFGGALAIDSLGSLYLTVGDGSEVNKFQAQNLNDYRGKVLRLDLSNSKKDPEIIAMGVRSPWGMTIDSKDRLFIMQCGNSSVESIYLLDNLYSDTIANFGWPVFEGGIAASGISSFKAHPDNSIIKPPSYELIIDAGYKYHLSSNKISFNSLYVPFQDLVDNKIIRLEDLVLLMKYIEIYPASIHLPIFRSSIRPGCMTAGIYLDNLESLLFSDWYGTIGLLKQQENGVWNLTHTYKQDSFIVGFGLDKKTNKIFIAPDNKELEITLEEGKLNQ